MRSSTMKFKEASRVAAVPEKYSLEQRAEAWKFFHEEIMDAENKDYKVECNLACSRIIEVDLREMRV